MHVSIRKFFAGAAVGALLLAMAGSAAAQSTTAAIQGQAKPGDIAIVQNLDTGVTREVKVDDKGRYRLRNLPTGNFSVTIKHPDGSIGESQNVNLRVGVTARIQ